MNKNIIISSIAASVIVIASVGIGASADEGYLGKDIQNKWEKLEGKFDRDNHKHFGKKMKKHLTDEEKLSLETMSDNEKTAFFEAKKAQRQEAKEAAKAVMDKILAGTTLSSIEEATRLEIVAKMEAKAEKSEGKRKGKNNESVAIMKKLVNLEALTAEEKTTLEQMKAKKEKRESAKEAIAPILEKKKAGTELSEDEQSQLEAFKTEYKSDKKGHRKKGGKRGNRGGGKRGNR